MADEGKEGTATEEVADADLAAAWEGEEAPKEAPKEEAKKEAVAPEAKTETVEESAVEAPPVEEQASEPTEAEKLTQQESSKLGRKVHGINERIKQLESQIATMNDVKIKNPVEVPEIISTPDDIERYMYVKQQREQQLQAEYEKSYLTTVQQLADVNKDIHDEVFAEMMQNYNVRYSPNGFSDARINYAEAKASVLTKKLKSSPTLPKREVASKAPVAPAATATRTTPKPSPRVDYGSDPNVKSYVDYLKRQGMSDDDIQKELA
jgi:hypothetical protein